MLLLPCITSQPNILILNTVSIIKVIAHAEPEMCCHVPDQSLTAFLAWLLLQFITATKYSNVMRWSTYCMIKEVVMHDTGWEN